MVSGWFSKVDPMRGTSVDTRAAAVVDVDDVDVTQSGGAVVGATDVGVSEAF
jgi:hypothetical protein